MLARTSVPLLVKERKLEKFCLSVFQVCEFPMNYTEFPIRHSCESRNPEN